MRARLVGPYRATVLAVLFMLAGCERSDETLPANTAAPGAVRNVVLITWDTTRADALGCYGRSPSPTPNLDRIAAQGTLFEQCVTSSPSTLPSHATIMTGLYPFAHGARSNAGFILPDANVTLAERFAEAGWQTAAEIAAPVIGRDTGLDQGFALYRDLDAPGVVRHRVVYPGNPKPMELPERVAEDITRAGVAFIRAHRQDRFFLWLHYFDPHRPYLPRTPGMPTDGRAAYDAELNYVDHFVGVFFEELSRLGLADSTLAVITADHGEGLGEHGEKTHSFFVYDTTMRVPLVLRGPGVPAGMRVGPLVRTVDIAPTILDFADLKGFNTAHGESLRTVMAGVGGDPDLLGYGESLEPFTLFDSSILRFVREGDWKYIHKLHPELYNVREDPAERTNLADQNAETTETLRTRLRELVADNVGRSPEATIAITDEARDRLAALGYVGAAPPSDIDDEVAALEARGPDPAAKTEDLEIYTDAMFEMRRQRYDHAIAKLSTGWQRNPDSLPMLEALINAMISGGREEEAVALLREAMRRGSESLRYRIVLAQIEADAGNFELAETHLRKALELAPAEAPAYVELAGLLERRQQYQREREVFEDGLRVNPESLELLNNYAMLLAACPVDELRNGERAVELATTALRIAGGDHPAVLDTLAAAYAETGDFAQAMAIGQRALSLLQGRDQPELIQTIRTHLQSYQAHRPVRMD